MQKLAAELFPPLLDVEYFEFRRPYKGRGIVSVCGVNRLGPVSIRERLTVEETEAINEIIRQRYVRASRKR